MENIDERIKQCDVDIAAMEEQKKLLLKKKKEGRTIKAGNIIANIFKELRFVVNVAGTLYVVNERGCVTGEEIQHDNVKEFNAAYEKIGKCTGFTFTESS